MIKFFRTIRQKMLHENKFSKFLLYAIGEIVLVVIGILIALQINNWNENNKLQKQEKQIYVELKSDLIQTKKDIENTAIQHKKAAKLTQQLIFDIQRKVAYSDTVYREFVSSNWDRQIIPKTSAFENLKNVGLNILSNDSLRMDLTNLYQLELKRFDDELGLSSSNDNIKKLLYPYIEKYLYADIEETKSWGFKHTDSIVVPNLIIKDYDVFLIDNSLIKALQLTLYNRNRKVDLETETIIKIDETIKRIDKEFDKLNK
ncbi:hypothetical protein DI383_12860 [Flavobacteriaceae bacterium LYZ1037]|nr:hypothetical protein DI383_12860 [Flavobacteriaceae bacterium LYZ1037]